MPSSARILTAQAITATGQEPGGHSCSSDSMSVQIQATAITGTPSVTASVLWPNDGTNYAPASPPDSIPVITAVGGIVARFAAKGPFFKLAWLVTGVGTLTTTADTWE